MLSLGDRNPKGTTILPRSKAYLIVPVAGNFKQFPQLLCQVALSSLSGWYANQRHREIRRALGIAQADLHSQSSPTPAPAFSFATTSTTYYYCHITGTSSSFTSSASAALTREGLWKQDTAFNTFFLFISLLYLPYFPAKKKKILFISVSNSRVGVSKHRFIDCTALTFLGQIFNGDNGWEASAFPRIIWAINETNPLDFQPDGQNLVSLSYDAQTAQRDPTLHHW